MQAFFHLKISNFYELYLGWSTLFLRSKIKPIIHNSMLMQNVNNTGYWSCYTLTENDFIV